MRTNGDPNASSFGYLNLIVSTYSFNQEIEDPLQRGDFLRVDWMEFAADEFGRYVWTDIPAIDLQPDNIVALIYAA